jgi:hypothetical protein
MKSIKSKPAMKSQGAGDYDHTQEQRLQEYEHTLNMNKQTQQKASSERWMHHARWRIENSLSN